MKEKKIIFNSPFSIFNFRGLVLVSVKRRNEVERPERRCLSAASFDFFITFLANSKALSISYPPAPESARTVRFRFYILYFAFFSRVRSAFPAFAGRYSSIQVPAFITSAQHTSDTECCFKNIVENTISTVRPRQTFRNTGRFLSCSLCSTATATATELYT